MRSKRNLRRSKKANKTRRGLINVTVDILGIWTVLVLFIITALINGGSPETKLQNKIISSIVIIVPYILGIVITRREIIRRNRTLFSFLWNNKPLFIIAFITVISRIWMFKNQVKWDSGEYYFWLDYGCDRFEFTIKSFIEVFSLCSHTTHAFSLFTAIGEFLAKGDVNGYRIITLILSVVTLFCLYDIAQRTLNIAQAPIGGEFGYRIWGGRKNSKKRRLDVEAPDYRELFSWAPFFITLIISMLPLVWGTFSYLNADYYIAFFFVFAIWCHMHGQIFNTMVWLLFCFGCKETGITLAAGYMLAVSIYAFVRAKNKKSILYKNPFCFFTLLALVGGSIILIVRGSLSSWKITKNSEEWNPYRSNLVKISFFNISMKLKHMFVLNFAWILTIILIMCLLILILEKVGKRNRYLFGKKIGAVEYGCFGGLLAFCLFNFFFVTATLYRYLVVWVVLFTFIVLILMWDRFPVKASIFITGMLFVLFGIQTFWYMDPLSNIMFARYDNGGGKYVLVTSNNVGDQWAYFGDGLINNYCYNWENDLFEQMLNDVDYDSDTVIILAGSQNSGTQLTGNSWRYTMVYDADNDRYIRQSGKETGDIRQISTFCLDAIIPKLPYDYVNVRAFNGNEFPEKAIVFFLPCYNEDIPSTMNFLNRVYEVSEVKSKSNWMGKIFYYELNIRDKYKGKALNALDFSGAKRADGINAIELLYKWMPVPEEDEELERDWVKKGDVVNVQISGSIDGEGVPRYVMGDPDTGLLYKIRIGEGALVGELENKMIGKRVDDVVTEDYVIPEGYPGIEKYAGKTIHLSAKILNVYDHKDLSYYSLEDAVSIINDYSGRESLEEDSSAPYLEIWSPVTCKEFIEVSNRFKDLKIENGFGIISGLKEDGMMSEVSRFYLGSKTGGRLNICAFSGQTFEVYVNGELQKEESVNPGFYSIQVEGKLPCVLELRGNAGDYCITDSVSEDDVVLFLDKYTASHEVSETKDGVTWMGGHYDDDWTANYASFYIRDNTYTTLDLTFYTMNNQNIKVYINGELCKNIENAYELFGESIDISNYKNLVVTLQSDFEFFLSEKDLRLASFVMNAKAR